MCGLATVDVDGAVGRGPVLASLVVVADAPWCDRVAAFLIGEGYCVRGDSAGAAPTGSDVRAVDAVILDLALTARPALDVCVAWRKRSTAPILAVTRVDDEAMVLDAYDAGVDQVASIDITDRQLLARLRSVLRRSPSLRPAFDDESNAGVRPIELDADQLLAVIDRTPVLVSQQEYDFLELLIDRAGKVVSRQELVSMLGLPPANGRAVDFFVRRLREKLERIDDQRRIRAIRGVGFRYDPGGDLGADG